MPEAFGRDRIESLDGGCYCIVSPLPKGWQANRPATRTTAEFPGTTVVWNDSLWEVLTSEECEGASSRYVLAPWKDHHAIRLTVDYNTTSEQSLEAEHRKSATRSRVSAGLFAAGLVAGLLPAHVQREIESEYGFVATRMSLVSLVTELAVAAIGILGLPIEGLAGPKWPLSVFLVASFALMELLLRGSYCLLRNQPVGSVPGLLFWAVASMASQRVRRFDRAATRRAERGLSSRSVRPPGDFEREHDAYTLREPFLALLPAADQARLAATFGFDPFAWGRRTALTISIIAGAGIVSSLLKITGHTSTTDTWISLALATLLFAEQVKRFREVARGNAAGSVLGALARPFCTALLAMSPRGLEPGTTEPLARSLPDVWDGDEGPSKRDDGQTGR